jgi:hypothetical protein
MVCVCLMVLHDGWWVLLWWWVLWAVCGARWPSLRLARRVLQACMQADFQLGFACQWHTVEPL